MDLEEYLLERTYKYHYAQVSLWSDEEWAQWLWTSGFPEFCERELVTEYTPCSSSMFGGAAPSNCRGTTIVRERLVPAFTLLKTMYQSDGVDAVLTNLNMFADDRNIRNNARRTFAENFIRDKFESDNEQTPRTEEEWGSQLRSLGFLEFAPHDFPIFTSITTWFHSERDDRIEGILLLLHRFAENNAISSQKLQQLETNLREFFEKGPNDPVAEYRPRISFENGKKKKRKVRVRAIEPPLLRVSTDIDNALTGKDCQGADEACDLYIIKEKGDFLLDFN